MMKMPPFASPALFLWAIVCFPVVTVNVRAQSPRPIEFNRDVRPILSDACFHCHGPDKSKRKAGLHFDTEEGARADLDGHFAIVPGSLEQSAMIQRILTADKSKRMPPPSAAVGLTARQIDTLKRWVTEGAKWQKHWAFIPPVRPALPAVKDKAWPRNPIDHFVLARLEEEGLRPAPEADPVTLLRRLSFDLTGLPPTPEEVDDFVAAWAGAAAKRQAAVEKAADRLLASPRFGERMAQRWLDGARYADTNGYQTDGDRIMWRWRDWVIDAFNNNMPFDRFTKEQIAGDMFPGATLEQKIATGFNRNHRGNSEGGVIPEEFAVEYVVDRVDTTSTVWLGLTTGCARCHNHKYDPITQKEFYQLFAYFNNVPERGKAIKYGNSPPYIKTPTREQKKKLDELTALATLKEKTFRGLDGELKIAQDRWEKRFARNFVAADLVYLNVNKDGTLANINEELSTPQQVKTYLDARKTEIEQSAQGPDGKKREAKIVVVIRSHEAVRAARIVALIDACEKAGYEVGVLRVMKDQHFEWSYQRGLLTHLASGGDKLVDPVSVGAFGFFDKFTIAARIFPQGKQGGTIVSRMEDADRGEGYSVNLIDGRIHVHLVKRWLDDAIRVETEQSLAPDRAHHVLFSYDGSRLASGVKVFIDGRLAKLKVNLDDLNQSFGTKQPFRVGAGGGNESRFSGSINDIRIYDHVLAPQDVAGLANRDAIESIVATAPEKRSAAQATRLRSYFLDNLAPVHIRQAFEEMLRSKNELERFDESLPTTMVMQEMPTPRPTHILLRGEYDKKGAKVLPGVPGALPPLPKGSPNNRLGFANWLVARDNPLTARVTVNRFWQMLFGTGIVKTVEDFGAQGDWPSHPELLDWLAVEFMDGSPNWDVKRLLKTIVTSATYRQSSRVTPEARQRDPDNRLLGRGPRIRLSADMIRDQALFASGLLVEKIGGPSVKPYQPAGLAKELTGTEDYVQDHGPNLYRRSLYTFWKRTIAPATLLNFDAANRETCVVRETRTNTPLQALNLMNEITFVEAARVLAARVLQESGPDVDARLTHAFRLTAARVPRAEELKVLRTALEFHLANYRRSPAAAQKLVGTGEAPRYRSLDVSEHAAYTAVCNLILNLDEVITKE